MDKRSIAATHKKSLRDYLTMVFRRKWLFVIPCVLAAGLMVTGMYSLPKQYRAFALARRTDQAMMSAVMAGQNAASERTALAVIREEILVPKQLVRVLKHTEVLGVLDDPVLRKSLSSDWDMLSEEAELVKLDEIQKSLEKVRKSIKIDVIARSPGTEIIEIAVTDQNRDRARLLANAIVTTYQDYHRKVLEDAATEAIKFPQEQLEKVKGQLKKAEDELETFRTQKFESLPEEKMATLRRRADLDYEIPRLENNLEAKEKKIKENEDALKAQPKTIPQTVSMGESEEAVTLRQQIRQMEVEREALARQYTPMWPDLRRLDNDLAAAKKRLEDLEKNAGGAVSQVEVENPLWKAMNAEQAQLLEDRRTLTTQLSGLVKERSLLDEKISGFTPEAYRYGEMVRERESLVKEYEWYRTQVKQSQLQAYLQKEKQGTTVTVIQLALLPQTPSFPPDALKVMLIALGVGIAVGIGVVLLGEVSDHSFRTVEDASEYLEIPILGTVGTIRPAMSVSRMWVTRAVLVQLVAALIVTAVMSYYHQDALRAALKSITG